MQEFQDAIRSTKGICLYPRFMQLVLNNELTPTERAVCNLSPLGEVSALSHR